MQLHNKPADTGHVFAPEILREYDIRGLVGETLNTEDAYALGCAFGTYVQRKSEGNFVCVAYDGRDTSPELANSLIQGLVSVGIDVENLGLGPTPMLYFAVKDRMADGGIMVTGSHNPSAYNGFKMTLQKEPVFGEAVQELGALAANADYTKGKGSVRDLDIKDMYVERLLRDFETPKRPLKMVWDCGNGAAGEIVRRMTEKLPGEHILLFDEIDGNFPNHHPDPTVDENLEDLIKTVKTEMCDLGVAFDGDGDRIGVVDELGRVIRCDLLMAIYAKAILEANPGATIIGDVKCSQVMFDEIERLNGNPVMWKTGHSHVKSKMAELKAPLAGELSGHIFFSDKYYGFDDAPYCAIRLMNQLSDSEGTLSEMTSALPVLRSTPEVRFEVPESEKFGIIERIAGRLKSNSNDDVEIVDIDGVRINTADGWWLLRASNTQNALVTRAEADNKENLEKLKKMVQEELQLEGCSLTFPD